uniref:Uncharacterized protein n=1 Tax=Mycena chlorophos TaxID=658473 RepID=A0ABQ0KZK2_MYCCL|nr:predicted protein [Mycena chlorophos]
MAPKIVLVTGANKGIGLEIVRQIANKAGYHVLLGARDAERGQKAVETLSGLPVEFLSLDIDDDASIAAAVKTVESKFGRLDVLVNNAGVLLDAWDSKVQMATREIFQKTFNTNATSAAMVTEAFVPLLSKALTGKPNVVFMSSDMGSLGQFADPEGKWQDAPMHLAAYRSSKAAMNMLALVYVARFRGQGWRINIDNPGYTATDLNLGTGPGTLEDGARNAVRLATLEEDGVTATFSEKEGPLPW